VSSCLFCDIAAGTIDSDVVHSTDGVVAFRDVNPQAPTHLLVIPREHIASVGDLTSAHEGTLVEIFEVLRQLAERESLGGGYRVVTNAGPDAGQSVDHLHFHLLGGRSLGWPPG
jgi:histidine triad (HIT) family protein